MTSSIDAESPIENAARRLNTLHHHLDMPRRRREARVAAEGLLDVEVMAEVLRVHWLRPTDARYGGSEAVSTRMCDCGHTLRPQYFEWRHFEEHNTHVAEAARAALLGGQASDETKETGPELTVSGANVSGVGDDCGSCAACDPGLFPGATQYPKLPSRMNVCPDCGNKRCPKAADHAKWECSGTNDVGQVGVRLRNAEKEVGPIATD